MIDEVLKEILATEEKADEIKREADEYALKKAKEADDFDSALSLDTEKQVKALRKLKREEITKASDALYNDTLADANKEAEAQIKKVEVRIISLADKIIERIINGDC